MTYRFLRAALAEHLDAVAFYESQYPGPGADYLAEFEAVMKSICANTKLYPRIGEFDIRKAPLKRFPFHVIYRANTIKVIVLAVAHQRRRPAFWAGRIGK